MIRVFDRYISARSFLEVVADFLSSLLAAILAAVTLELIRKPIFGGRVMPTVVWEDALVFAAAVLVLYIVLGVYQRDRQGSLQFISIRVGLTISLSAIPLYILYRSIGNDITNELIIYFLALAYFYQFVGLLLIRATLTKAYSMGYLRRKILILGCGPEALATAADIRSHGGEDYQIIGFYPSTHEQGPATGLPATLFPKDQSLYSIVESNDVEEIVVTVRERRGGAFSLRELLESRTRGVTVYSQATFSERIKGEVPLNSLKASWLIYGSGFAQGFVRTFVKRVFDVLVSMAVLAVAWPVMLIAALAIIMEDGGPVFFRQERTGQHGKSFQCLKFRSMRTDAEKDGIARWAQTDDVRVTRVGLILRKTRIDEFPQLLGVLTGKMSLVGPRPERPVFVRQLVEQIPYYDIRHSVKPGVTGWAQVRYSYGSSIEDARKKLEFDLYYVKNHSLLLDLQIILETVSVVLLGKGAR